MATSEHANPMRRSLARICTPQRKRYTSRGRHMGARVIDALSWVKAGHQPLSI